MQASQLQNRFEKIRSNKAFELFVIGVILFSALLVGAKTYDMPSTVNQITNLLDWFISAFFLVELTIRFLAERRKLDFFKSFWNWFDTIIVLVSLLPLENSDTALIARLVRVFRVLRMISIIPELRILLVSLMKALPQLGYVMLLMFIIFYIYAAIGSTLFEQINPVLWGDITISLLTLFRVMTFEDWTDHPNTFYANKLRYTFDNLRKTLKVMSNPLPFKMSYGYFSRSQNNRNQTIYL